MKIIVVGGGRLAYFLIEALLQKKHQITLIEEVLEVGEILASKYEDVTVVHADGTDLHVLEKIGCAEADCYIAVTGKDENNLIGCQIAKRKFGVRRTCARVNNPRNQYLYRHMGIDLVYSSTDIMVDMIEQDIDYEGMRIVYSVPDSSENIVEIQLDPRSDAVGKKLKEYRFPGLVRVVMILDQNGDPRPPTGDSVMRASDRILLICREAEYEAIYDSLVSPD